MSVKKSFAYIGALSVIIGLSGCSSTFHKTSSLGALSVLSLDAKQRIVVSGHRDNQAVVCAEPSPDAMVAQASYLATNFNKPNKANASIAAGSDETASSIGVRTQTIQLLRDGYYRVCEAYLNGIIGLEEYQDVLDGVDEFMVALVAIEALGGVVKAPNVTISATKNVLIDGNGTVSATKKEGSDVLTIEQLKEAIKTIKIDTKGLSVAQTEAITTIAINYMKRKSGRFYKISLTKNNK